MLTRSTEEGYGLGAADGESGGREVVLECCLLKRLLEDDFGSSLAFSLIVNLSRK